MAETANNEKKEALCFTVGPKAAVFSCGVIHAYLAADRPAPGIAAGISMGSLSAAAIQRCYQDLQNAKESATRGKLRAEQVEAARWKWFRKYLAALTDRPLSVIWDGLPDQSDFFAELPPIKDSAAGLFELPDENNNLSEFQNNAVKRDYEEDENSARRELFLYVKLGRWLAKLPIPLSAIVDLLVTRVRAKENYPGFKPLRILRFWIRAIWISIYICIHGVGHPEWFPEHKFDPVWPRYYRRPLFGWAIYLGLFGLVSLLTLAVPVALLYLAFKNVNYEIWRHVVVSGRNVLAKLPLSILFTRIDWIPFLLTFVTGLVIGILFLLFNFVFAAFNRTRRILGRVSQEESRARRQFVSTSSDVHKQLTRALVFLWRPVKNGLLDGFTFVFNKISQHAMKQVQLEKHLIHPYHLRVRLARLFGNAGLSPSLNDEPFPIVLVTSPLEQLDDGLASQLWAQPSTPLVEALRASLALPGLFSPVVIGTRMRREDVQEALLSSSFWVKANTPLKRLPYGVLNLVDGAVVRRNPLPALFMYLRDKRRTSLANSLISCGEHDARIHVIYGEPLSKKASSEVSQIAPDIVDVALKGFRLQSRRDTDVEIKQTNFTSFVEQEIRQRTTLNQNAKNERDVRPIFADAIAPESDLSFGRHPLNPSPREFYTIAAEGCRRTLESLYSDKIKQLSDGRPSIACSELLRSLDSSPPRQGLPEICERCSQLLSSPKTSNDLQEAVAAPVARQFKAVVGERAITCGNYEGDGRIVFIASGGVFRGAFHGGMIGALLAGQIRPQLIVGASVGTLMGSALAAMLSAEETTTSLRLLRELVDVFLHVDERIAFTKTFKGAVRELGIRGKAVRLSPNQLRKMIMAGSKSDPVFAITGAPSPLIDAITDLLMIPHKRTQLAASSFVSGHVTKAVQQLTAAIKTETLRRLDIRQWLIGTSLLHPTTTRLLDAGIPLSSSQPFAPHIGIFCTTTDLNQETLVVLGGQEEHAYDFVQAALSSSAFPAVFRPRSQSEIRPGVGSITTYYSDGGIFDNLPFLPAIEALASIQKLHAADNFRHPVDYLRNRHSSPDLFLVGSLDVQANVDENRYGPFDDLVSITKRANLLQNNIKIEGFVDSSNRIHHQLDVLLDTKNDYTRPSCADTVNGIVDAATLPVYPSDQEHLNPTFAFCASTGFRPDRAMRSVADGCFQTFRALVDCYTTPPSVNDRNPMLRKAVTALQDRRLPTIDWNRTQELNGECPYFVHSTDLYLSIKEKKFHSSHRLQRFACPFYKAWELTRDREDRGGEGALQVYSYCCSDKDHKQLAEQGRLKQPINCNTPVPPGPDIKAQEQSASQ